MTVLGAVLTGGASRRMGRDKATLPIDGVAMADRVAVALRAGCADVVAIGPAERAGEQQSVADMFPAEGPVGGVITALREAARRGCSHAFVVACDLPFLDTATVQQLLAAGLGHGAESIAVAHTDRVEPLCAVWPVSVTAPVEQIFADGERAMHRVLDALAVTTVDVHAAALRNVNTPGDLAEG
jgi:molybdenum cofactor guanylyltransferase